MTLRINLLTYRVLDSLRNSGIGETCRRAGRYLFSRFSFMGSSENSFDLTYNTDTGGISPVWKLDTDSTNARFGERYQAISVDQLHAALAFLNEDWSTFTFVDLGCGKGRALIAASQQGFARVIGVEFAKSLVEIARKNSEITGARAEVRHGDAAQFEFPKGDLVVFMFNPFRGQVMRQVMDNLVRHSEGKLYLLYHRPEQMAIVDERTDFLAKIGTIPTAPEFCAWQRYDSIRSQSNAVVERAAEMEFRVETLRTSSELEAVRDFWMSENTHRDADFDFYQFILELFPHVIRPHVIAVYHGQKPKVLIVGRLENRSLDIRIGYWRLQTPKLRTLTIIHGGAIGNPSEEESEAILANIINQLKGGEATLAFFESLDIQSALYARAITIPGFAHSDHFRKLAVHYARSPGRKPFLESLSSHERNNHRRRAKRILAAFPAAVRIERFDDLAALDLLMRDAETVATKSYQRGLGVGFVSSTEMRRRLEFESSKGWLHGYVLYVEDRPLAFWIGSLHRGTFYSDFLGYDPDYAKFGPGMYLIIHVLEELSKSYTENSISAFDFGAGEGEWKAILSDRRWQEAQLYMFAPGFQGLCLNILRSVPAAMDVQARRILNKTKILARVKKKWRDKLTRNVSDKTEEKS